MKLVRIGALVALAVAVAACGGGDDEAEATRPDEPSEATTKNLTVRVVADQSGFGCTEAKERAAVDVGNGSRLTVTDQDGATVGTGTFELSPGLVPGEDTCDWTAVAEGVADDADFYTLDASGELLTVSANELGAAGWSVSLRIAVDGSVKVE